jgi:hypothetical protein
MDDKAYDNLLISEMSIAGTHDAAAINASMHTPYACHYKTITEQLYGGIRLLDVRIKVKQSQNSYEFATCHGDIGSSLGLNEYQSLQSLLDECDKFLKTYPSEFIVMTLKIDDWGGHKDDANTVFNALNSVLHKAQNRYCSNTVPKVSEVRGKIVFLSRLDLGEHTRFGMPITWTDNTAGEAVKPNDYRKCELYVQDKYKGLSSPEETEKLGLVKAALKNKTGSNLLLNFASATKYLIGGVYIGKGLLSYFGETPASERQKKLGWTLFDYESTKYTTSPYGEITIVDLYIDANRGYKVFQNKFIVTGENDEL